MLNKKNRNKMKKLLSIIVFIVVCVSGFAKSDSTSLADMFIPIPENLSVTFQSKTDSTNWINVQFPELEQISDENVFSPVLFSLIDEHHVTFPEAKIVRGKGINQGNGKFLSIQLDMFPLAAIKTNNQFAFHEEEYDNFSCNVNCFYLEPVLCGFFAPGVYWIMFKEKSDMTKKEKKKYGKLLKKQKKELDKLQANR